MAQSCKPGDDDDEGSNSERVRMCWPLDSQRVWLVKRESSGARFSKRADFHLFKLVTLLLERWPVRAGQRGRWRQQRRKRQQVGRRDQANWIKMNTNANEQREGASLRAD